MNVKHRINVTVCVFENASVWNYRQRENTRIQQQQWGQRLKTE